MVQDCRCPEPGSGGCEVREGGGREEEEGVEGSEGGASSFFYIYLKGWRGVVHVDGLCVVCWAVIGMRDKIKVKEIPDKKE